MVLGFGNERSSLTISGIKQVRKPFLFIKSAYSIRQFDLVPDCAQTNILASGFRTKTYFYFYEKCFSAHLFRISSFID